jgi:outer membrane lipoprotein-sorting protein
MRIRQALALGLVGLTPALTGCLIHTRTVPKTRLADPVMDATLNKLLQQVDQRFDAVDTLTATVEIVATTGGGRQGKETQYPSFPGYIFIRKPEDLRVLLRVPLLGSQAMDMVSDGKKWKLWVPNKKLAMTGISEVAEPPSENPLENLRPAMILNSIVIKGLAQEQIVSLTLDSRTYPDPKNKREFIEEPDYDLAILEQPKGQTAHTVRVIHIGRTNLLPYQEDIYGADGTVATRAFFDKYQKVTDAKGVDLQFPMKIVIKRPQDELTLAITVTKVVLNQKLEDDQFELVIPEGVPVRVMK